MSTVFNKSLSAWLLVVLMALAFASQTIRAKEQLSVTAVYEVQDMAGVYLQATLPHSIYRYSNSSQLTDVVVLDRDGNALPSKIVKSTQAKRKESEPVALEFFQVSTDYVPSDSIQGNTQLQIEKGVIAISMEQGQGQSSEEPFYLIDLSERAQALQSVALEWVADTSSQYLPVTLSGSNDLVRWTTLTQDTLVKLNKEGQALLRNKVQINLAAQRYQYLRIDFPENREVQLTEVLGQQPHSVEPPSYQHWQVQGRLAEKQRSIADDDNPVSAWEYQRNDKAPVQALNINLGQTTHGDTVRIYSRSLTNGDWRVRFNGVWFNAKVGDTWQHSDAMNLSPNADPYWRVEFNPNLSRSAEPKLVFQYPSQNLQFIANNNRPYQVAVVAEVPAERASAKVFTQVMKGQQVDWINADLIKLDSIARPDNSESLTHWTDVLFWITLVLAVVVLLVCALRLLRQLQHED
ncbi:DUF3999 family protein [Marinomonas atlantica]|uniref:DUF3999 family protein n=1 Tax=Marinomonas atlantica TaxID=1806668 RepID=UPI0008334E31|nr:DUF3999 family protein [Marinomonas atlantica]MCO4785230.1 DUF3999 family protein [Marinomonas atlantica]